MQDLYLASEGMQVGSLSVLERSGLCLSGVRTEGLLGQLQLVESDGDGITQDIE